MQPAEVLKGQLTKIQASRSKHNHRAQRACEACRAKKQKCNGEKPTCQRCENKGYTCEYIESKREQSKKTSDILTEKIQGYENIIQQILPQIDQRSRIAAQVILSKTPSLESQPTSFPRPDKSTSRAATNAGRSEYRVSARKGSAASTDTVNDNVDKNDQSRAFGLYNKPSEVSWMKMADEHLKSSTFDFEHTKTDRLFNNTEFSHNYSRFNDVSFANSSKSSIADMIYHLDDLPQLDIASTVVSIMPSQPIADHLIQSYFNTVHASLPFFLKNTFIARYYSICRAPEQKANHLWLAALNFVFAIGAFHSHLSRSKLKTHIESHTKYYARACSLIFESRRLLGDQPSVDLVQSLGLFAFYLTATSQINRLIQFRAWIMAGIALRIAQSIGMHLLNTSSEVFDVQKESATRTWWSVLNLERLLCVMCGRPSGTADIYIRAALPLDIDEDDLFDDNRPLYLSQRPVFDPLKIDRILEEEGSIFEAHLRHHTSFPSKENSFPTDSPGPDLRNLLNQSITMPSSRAENFNESSYFSCSIELCTITHAIAQKLFSPSALSSPWVDIQKFIFSFDRELKRWHRSLPSSFDFSKTQRDQECYSRRLSLGFSFYSAQLLLYRSCLCRLDLHIPNQSKRSNAFNLEIIKLCVSAAKNLIALLPDIPNCFGLYHVTSWWSTLHHIVQAGSILILAVSLRISHVLEKADEILRDAEKVVRWLQQMAQDNPAARRAKNIMLPLLQSAARLVRRQISDDLDQLLPQTHSSSHDVPQSTPHQNDQRKSTDYSNPTEIMFYDELEKFPVSSLDYFGL